jgi:mannose-6-phosphate isomerase
MYRLRCKTQEYDWGSYAKDSIVGMFTKEHSPFQLPPYAEFWIGSHPHGHSMLDIAPNKTIQDVIGCNKIPFLFKFLSVEKALSIQVHPDKEYAPVLHNTNPQMYSDPNHKPEMAIAIGNVSMLYGFKEDWRAMLQKYPEFSAFGAHDTGSIKDLITFILGESIQVHNIYYSILYRINTEKEDTNNVMVDKTDRLIETLADQHPNDTGALIAIFMNLVELNPKEAICIRPNILHAYLKGELAECMACSDNVIRAGLTTKPKDIPSLLHCLWYDTGLPEIIKPCRNGMYVTQYDEFQVACLDIKNIEEYTIACTSGVFVVVQSGKGYIDSYQNRLDLNIGDVFYINMRRIHIGRLSHAASIWVVGTKSSFSIENCI